MSQATRHSSASSLGLLVLNVITVPLTKVQYCHCPISGLSYSRLRFSQDGQPAAVCRYGICSKYASTATLAATLSINQINPVKRLLAGNREPSVVDRQQSRFSRNDSAAHPNGVRDRYFFDSPVWVEPPYR